MHPVTAQNDVVRCGIEVGKHDSQTSAAPQGNADFAGIVFEIVNVSTNPVVVEGKTIALNGVALTMTTDENGHAETMDDALPYGRYTVREKSTNKSMLLTWPREMVTGMAAQEESLSISKNMRWSYQKRKGAGTFVGTKSPMGFDLVNGQLIHNSEAETVQEIFQFFYPA